VHWQDRFRTTARSSSGNFDPAAAQLPFLLGYSLEMVQPGLPVIILAHGLLEHPGGQNDLK
jgi:hypothetical protein